MGTALHGRPSWDQFDDLTTMAVRDAGAMMWDRTDLTPADVDVAELYDGFSFIALAWLEALRFCGHGEGGPVPRGRRHASPATARSRSTPTAASCRPAACTATGSCTRPACSCGTRAGERQVVRPGGRRPEVAVAAAGGGPLAASLLLTRR